MVAQVIADRIEKEAPLTREEVAAFLRVHPETVGRTLDGTLKPVRIGRRLRYDRERVMAYARGELS